MNKAKLKQEAEEYALNQWEGNFPWSVIQKAYYDGALPREECIEMLEQQVDKLKCCGNCAEVCSSMSGDWKECWRNGEPTRWRLKTR